MGTSKQPFGFASGPLDKAPQDGHKSYLDNPLTGKRNRKVEPEGKPIILTPARASAGLFLWRP
jgi:hypothetical protein